MTFFLPNLNKDILVLLWEESHLLKKLVEKCSLVVMSNIFS